ncbi:MAG: tRNA (adenosine(37)-N6)-threonylcarbamoyltransferase complex dimerization subunit type 1 TsaB [Vibrionaceae bacterium]
MTIILAIDTTTENCSVAVRHNGEELVCSELAQQSHAAKILPMVDNVLAQAQLSLEQLDVIAFGRGPGSFTGVRIGVSVAQGLAFARDLPLVGISSLAALAQQTYRLQGKTQVLSAIDARMQEIYVGGYVRGEDGDWRSAIPEQVVAPEKFAPEFIGEWVGAGTGWQTYPERAAQLNLPNFTPAALYPMAQDMAFLAQFAWARGEAVAPELAQPVYLRDTVTWQKLPHKA